MRNVNIPVRSYGHGSPNKKMKWFRKKDIANGAMSTWLAVLLFFLLSLVLSRNVEWMVQGGEQRAISGLWGKTTKIQLVDLLQAAFGQEANAYATCRLTRPQVVCAVHCAFSQCLQQFGHFHPNVAPAQSDICNSSETSYLQLEPEPVPTPTTEVAVKEEMISKKSDPESMPETKSLVFRMAYRNICHRQSLAKPIPMRTKLIASQNCSASKVISSIPKWIPKPRIPKPILRVVFPCDLMTRTSKMFREFVPLQSNCLSESPNSLITIFCS